MLVCLLRTNPVETSSWRPPAFENNMQLHKFQIGAGLVNHWYGVCMSRVRMFGCLPVFFLTSRIGPPAFVCGDKIWLIFVAKPVPVNKAVSLINLTNYFCKKLRTLYFPFERNRSKHLQLAVFLT